MRLHYTLTLVLSMLIIAFPKVVLSDTYLCIPEATAGVSSGEDGFDSHIFNTDNRKIILSNESGEWLVKEHGADFALDECSENGFECLHSKGYGGAFLRGKDGHFFYNSIERKDNANYFLVTTGNCTKL